MVAAQLPTVRHIASIAGMRHLSLGNQRHRMTARLTILGFFAVVASSAAAQDTISMTASDSAAVIRGAVRAALAIPAGARAACFTYIADSLATRAGRTFIAEGRAVAGLMRSPDDSAGRLGVTLLALAGRDTARVVLRLDGDDGPRAHAAWINEIEYDFTRGASSGSWRLVGHKALYFADYVVDDSLRAQPPSCLNGRRRQWSPSPYSST
jgi:hypothetical protein